MCGIAGFVDFRRETSAGTLSVVAGKMAHVLNHRGPDAHGSWTDAQAGVALAHTRLAIRDLSPAGHQPMESADGRFVLVYNGEVYDCDPIRAELEGLGHRFKGTSDTEVVLAAFVQWGVHAALERFNGMFAFALWDHAERRLTLGRDRFGIKPLCWAEAPGLFLFGSEPRALLQHPDYGPGIDRNAVTAYLHQSCVPAPLCIFEGARKLEPGTLVVVEDQAFPEVQRWWDGRTLAGLEPLDLGFDAAVDETERLVGDAVARRLVSDVPLGVFLSGGIDSSLVAAMMAARGDGPVRSFTIGFSEADYDESQDAARIAEHLGCDHTAVTLTPEEARAPIAELAGIYDEPFADSSQIPMVLVSRLAREKVTVVLSGDGGDEVFCGYNRHLWASRDWPRIEGIPRPLRRLGAGMIEALPPRLLDGLGGPLGLRQAGEKLHKLAAVLPADDLDAAYGILVGQGVESPLAVPDGLPADPLNRLRMRDTLGYLPDDILTKVDRATMAVGLEARVPLLDPTLASFAWRLPASGLLGKTLTRAVLARHVPKALFEGRPKSGFAVPLADWLRGPLKEWAGDLVESPDDYLDQVQVRTWWSEHLSGRRNRHHQLWNVLMFRAWLPTP